MTETEFIELNEKEIKELKARGYEIIKKLGEGCTRRVYEAIYRNGDLQKMRVLKIPRKDIPDNSIWTKVINMKRENNDNNLLELKAASKISHENIEETLDTFSLNGGVVNVGEFVDGWNLYDFIRANGSASKETTNNIMSQLLNAEEYLQDNNILHRDLKPTNILVKRNGKVKLTDLQTAATLDGIVESMLPTRGGASYTHPKLLNAVLTGEQFKANGFTEAYSLGAILFYCLTGKELFDYKLVQDPEGKQITIGKDCVNVSLMNCGELTNKISEEEHDKFIRKEIKAVPKPYRKILEKSLRFSSDYDIRKFKSDFEGVNFAKEKALQRTGRLLRNGFYLALTGFFLGLGFDAMKESAVEQDLSMNQQYSANESIRYKSIIRNENLITSNMTELPVQYTKYIKEFERKKDNLKESVELAQWLADRSNFNKNLIKAAILSAALEGTTNIKKEYGRDRSGRFAVPLDFIRIIDPEFNRSPPDMLEMLEEGGMAVQYLINSYNCPEEPSHTFVDYFCSEDEVIMAKALAKNGEYLQGYREHISPTKRRLIERALALYYSMDRKGNVTSIKYQNISPDSGLAER